MYKIMLIEDDVQLSELTSDHLKRYGYEIYVPNDFQHILDEFTTIQPDLILLDINLPYYDGYFLCRSIRKKSNVPIIITSARSSEMDQVMAIELGADDYLTKPFTFEILHSKVKASIRRVYGEYADKETGVLCVQSLCVDSQAFAASYKGKDIDLSKNEYKLLRKLMEHHSAYVTREVLMEEVWDSHTFVDDNTLTVNITRIKQKLASIGLKDAISSKRNVGYLLNVGDKDA